MKVLAINGSRVQTAALILPFKRLQPNCKSATLKWNSSNLEQVLFRAALPAANVRNRPLRL